MSYSTIYGFNVCKIKTEKNEDKYIFSAKTSSSNSYPKTPTWGLMNLKKNKEEAIEYVSNYFSSLNGGSLRISSHSNLTGVDSFLDFFKSAKRKIEKASYLTDKNNEVIIFKEFTKENISDFEIALKKELKNGKDIPIYETLIYSSYENYNPLFEPSKRTNVDIVKIEEKISLLEEFNKDRNNILSLKFQERIKVLFSRENNKDNEYENNEILEHIYNNSVINLLSFEKMQEVKFENVKELYKLLSSFNDNLNTKEGLETFINNFYQVINKDKTVFIEEILKEVYKMKIEVNKEDSPLKKRYDFKKFEEFSNITKKDIENIIIEIEIKNNDKVIENKERIKNLSKDFESVLIDYYQLNKYRNGTTPRIMNQYLNKIKKTILNIEERVVFTDHLMNKIKSNTISEKSIENTKEVFSAVFKDYTKFKENPSAKDLLLGKIFKDIETTKNKILTLPLMKEQYKLFIKNLEELGHKDLIYGLDENFIFDKLNTLNNHTDNVYNKTENLHSEARTKLNNFFIKDFLKTPNGLSSDNIKRICSLFKIEFDPKYTKGNVNKMNYDFYEETSVVNKINKNKEIKLNF